MSVAGGPPSGRPQPGRLAVLLAAVVLMLGGCSCEGPQDRLAPPPPVGGVPWVRVKLGDDAARVELAAPGPWRLMAGGRQVAAGEDDLAALAVEPAGGGVRAGAYGVVRGSLELSADGGPIRVAVGDRPARAYRGRVRVTPTRDGRVRAINVVDMETYVATVAGSELPHSWHAEAFKAQAVAARTYVLAEQAGAGRRDFDVYDTVQSQAYAGVERESAKVTEAVAATRGVVCTWEAPSGRRELFKTYYHSTCGGGTAPAGQVFGGESIAPLAGGVECRYCAGSSLYRWGPIRISKADLTAAMRASGKPDLARFGPVREVRVLKVGPSGRAVEVAVYDASGRGVRVSANDWRGWVSRQIGGRGLPSTRFTVANEPDAVVVTGGGYGHGVGLCQYGAQYLAAHGLTAAQILRYYFPGVVLARAY